MSESPAPSYELRAAAATHVGHRRQHNEDTIRFSAELALYTVADGAGGHSAGDVASRLAAMSVENYVAATVEQWAALPEYDRHGNGNGARRLSAAIHKANHDVHEIAQASLAHRGMGTTFVGLLFSKRSPIVHVGHVGDSRCYRLRHGVLEQLTVDHSLVVDVLQRRPELSDAEVSALPRNVVTRALGMGPKLLVDLRTLPVVVGDRYLLCSDGLAGPVSNERIREALALRDSLEEIAQVLVDLALAAGGPDNIAALVVEAAPLRPAEDPLVEVGVGDGVAMNAGAEALLHAGLLDGALDGVADVDTLAPLGADTPLPAEVAELAREELLVAAGSREADDLLSAESPFVALAPLLSERE